MLRGAAPGEQMPPQGRRSPARLLAPLALLLFAAALVAVLLSSSVIGGENGQNSETAGERTAPRTTETTKRRRPRRAFYIVKLNDTLEAIATKTGLSVARLQELNPDVDPQALVAGQRIRLRE
jgi:LysM repeat protein